MDGRVISEVDGELLEVVAFEGEVEFAQQRVAELRDDRDGLVRYARNGIPCVWIVNLPANVIEVYTKPSGPGDAVFENDPGVIGALFADPNTTLHAAGRSFLDRAYVAKAQVSYRLPAAIELSSVADYLDGLPFARQLLVTGLAQGPIVVATTVRGSPEGGNRSQYVANWNLRLDRTFPLATGRITAAIDVFNVTNAAKRLQESDLSSPSFNQRLPVAIQPPRFARLELRYDF